MTVVALSARSPSQDRRTGDRPSIASSSNQVTALESDKALVAKYCVTCHNDRAKTGGLSLQQVSLENVPAGAETFEKVIRKLRGGMMPPLGAPRPEQPGIDGLVSFLETSIDRAAATTPNPGRSPLHRLNRSEYANAIRDLLALDIDASAYLPADDEAN